MAKKPSLHLSRSILKLNLKHSLVLSSLDPVEIVARLQSILKARIVPGETLLFLDEIQACPKAILALRYFKEKMGDLHVIAAGSLLEFAIQEGKFSFPVGRIQFLY
ncbi:MAG: AAA family ATPase, partial [Simkania sp.]|nr:AAA family ATPase [Simkania sp.]